MGGHAAYFTCTNRGKASLVLDLTLPKHRDRLKEAVRVCDVLVENFKAGSLERLGLGTDVLFQANPSLIRHSPFETPAVRLSARIPSFNRVSAANRGFRAVSGLAKHVMLKIWLQNAKIIAR